MGVFSNILERLESGIEIVRNSYRSILVVLVVSICTALITKTPFRSRVPDYQEGEVANRDIKAGETLRVVDEELTDKRRDAVTDGVLDVYDYDPKAKEFIFEKTSKALDLISGANARNADRFKSTVEEHLGVTLSSHQWEFVREPRYQLTLRRLVAKTTQDIASLWILEENTVPSRSEITLRDIRTSEEFRVSQKAYQKKIITIGEVRDLIRNVDRFRPKDFGEIPPRLWKDVLTLVANLVEADLVFNAVETKARQDEAKSKIDPLWAEASQGETIIREGQRVDRRHFLLLRKMRDEEKGRTNVWSFLTFSLLMFCLIFLFHFIGRTNFRKFKLTFKDQWVIGGFFVLSLGVVGLLLHLFGAARSQTVMGPSLAFLAPLAFAAMTLRLFTSMEITTFFSVIFGLTIGWMNQSPFWGLICLATSLAGASQMRHITQRFDVFRAGLVAGVINLIFVVIGMMLGQIPTPSFDSLILNYLIAALFSFSSGLLSSALVLGVQPLLEYLGYTTDLRLMELSNTNHPLLRDLILKAPGTYFHSFTVSQLAEKATESINGNILFSRVAALYHDIGKIKKAHYFIENIKGENKHDKLAPSMSAMIISNHVKDGIELGVQYKLPQSIIEVIPQHHGTALISYFWDKAKRQAPKDEDLDEHDFRYPGPRPQTRESAIILLADAVEATAKSLQVKSPDILKQTIHKTIERFFLDGQLDECDLTLKDLNAIGNAFLQVLQGVYHQRIDYPHLREEQTEIDEDAISNITKFRPTP